MATPIIEVVNLVKKYRNSIALDNINTQFYSGCTTAILGPNASGKSTLLKCILRLVLPDSGKVIIQGKDWHINTYTQECVAYMPQIPALPDNQNWLSLLSLLCALNPNHSANLDLASELGVDKFASKPFSTLSGGSKQKIVASVAFLFPRPIYILDEPTVGLDPVATIIIKKKIKSMVASGHSVLLTSHVLSEVDELADNLIYLLEGQIKYSGTSLELKKRYQANNIELALAHLLGECQNIAG